MRTLIAIDVFEFNEKIFSQSDIVNYLFAELLNQEACEENNLLFAHQEYQFKNDFFKLNANLLRIHPKNNHRYDDKKNDHFLVFHDRFQRSDRFFQQNVQDRPIQSEGVLIVDNKGMIRFEPDRSYLIQRSKNKRNYCLTEKNEGTLTI